MNGPVVRVNSKSRSSFFLLFQVCGLILFTVMLSCSMFQTSTRVGIRHGGGIVSFSSHRFTAVSAFVQQQQQQQQSPSQSLYASQHVKFKSGNYRRISTLMGSLINGNNKFSHNKYHKLEKGISSTSTTGLVSSLSTSSSPSSTSTTCLSATTIDGENDQTKVEIKTPYVHHPSFEIVKSDIVEEFSAAVTIFKHKKTGAEVMSVSVQDENKVFGVTFRTPPSDSTGVPHILEHSVLCGSRKYPVKEPFVDLLKGSLQTFLNAFTYPDRTCYPVASQNTKDFYNLMNVYLDAVYHPRATSDPLVLEQEGWHYELEDKNSPLTYKGVVFNEMKGVYSSPDSLMGRASQQQLFPDNTYGVDSGGDPLAIPNLTYEQFKDFHTKFYSPSNSRIYFYGDDDPMERLNIIEEYLKDFDAIEVDSMIKWQKKKNKPWQYEESFPATEDMKDKGMVSVNWLVNDEPLSLRDQLAWAVLNYVLIGTSASPLYKKLISSGLGESVIGGGLSDELLQATFSAGLKAVSLDDMEKVEDLVIKILKECVQEGFSKEAIDASMNSIEFSMREFNTGSFPRGLSFMLGAMQHWIYDEDPVNGLKFEKPLQELKDALANGEKVFENLIETYLVKNGHRCTIKMTPDTTLEAKQQQEEEEKLANVKASMSDADLEAVIQATKKLKEAQAAEDSPEARQSIPRLSKDDLEREQKEIPIEIGENQNVPVLTHLLPTNGILYADIAFDTRYIDFDDLPLLPIFTRAIMETGTSKEDEVALTQRIGTHTGGIRTSSTLSFKHSKDGKVNRTPDDFVSKFFIRGKAVQDKIPDLLNIMFDVLTDCNFGNQQRILEMLKESKARMQASVVGSGHSYAATRLSSQFSIPGKVSEVSGGITYMQNLDKLIDMAENNWPTIQKRLENMRSKIMNKKGMLLNLTGDAVVLERANEAIPSFISNIAESKIATQGELESNMEQWLSTPLNDKVNEGFAVPTQVNYVVKGGPIYDDGEEVKGSTSVVSRYLRTGYLWDNVRVMGGAYGGFCSFNPLTGMFSFLSYRDPNLDKTLAIYDNTANYLKDAHIPTEELEATIIGAVGDLDSPMGPDQKGFTSMMSYLDGETAEDRQRWRDEILDTSIEDFQSFGKRMEKLKDTASSTVIGSKKSITDSNDVLPKEQTLTLTELL